MPRPPPRCLPLDVQQYSPVPPPPRRRRRRRRRRSRQMICKQQQVEGYPTVKAYGPTNDRPGVEVHVGREARCRRRPPTQGTAHPPPAPLTTVPRALYCRRPWSMGSAIVQYASGVIGPPSPPPPAKVRPRPSALPASSAQPPSCPPPATPPRCRLKVGRAQLYSTAITGQCAEACLLRPAWHSCRCCRRLWSHLRLPPVCCRASGAAAGQEASRKSAVRRRWSGSGSTGPEWTAVARWRPRSRSESTGPKTVYAALNTRRAALQTLTQLVIATPESELLRESWVVTALPMVLDQAPSAVELCCQTATRSDRPSCGSTCTRSCTPSTHGRSTRASQTTS